jgi:hypothetical protein
MAESAHRDQSTNALPGDVIFGGWLALSGGDSFVFSPGSHRNNEGGLLPANGIGFAKLAKEEVKRFPMQRIAVPKFAVVLFHANIVHKVAASKRNTPLIRLFVGHRLTTHKEPLYLSDSPVLKKTLSRPPPPVNIATATDAGAVETAPSLPTATATAAAVVSKKRKRVPAASKPPAVVEGLTSPSFRDVFKRFRGPPLPSGQQFPIISSFAYGMHKVMKYEWLSGRYKPELFGLDAWPTTPLPWNKIGYMVPDAATKLLEASALVPKYTKQEKAMHVPHPI